MPVLWLHLRGQPSHSSWFCIHFPAAQLTRFYTPMTSREYLRPLTCQKLFYTWLPALQQTANLAVCSCQRTCLHPIGLGSWDIGRLGEGRVVPALSRSYANGRQLERAIYRSLCLRENGIPAIDLPDFCRELLAVRIVCLRYTSLHSYAWPASPQLSTFSALPRAPLCLHPS